MTLKVGMRDVISSRVVGDVKLFFRNIFMFLENLYIISKVKRNLISISCLNEQSYNVAFSLNKAFISKNSVHICSTKLENNLYILRPNEAKAILNHEMFKTANTKNKRQRISSNNNIYLWHSRLGLINLDQIRRLIKNELLNELKDDSLPPCESCPKRKTTKRPFTRKSLEPKSL